MPEKRIVLKNCKVIDPKQIASYLARDGFRAWQKVLEMIALKELKACRHGLHQNVEALSGRTVSW